MSIPLYDQQVSPPTPPRLRKTVNAEAGRASAMGQFGQQAMGTVSSFAGQLADLAAQNELNQSLIRANDQWRDFWSGLQKDPEYTTFQEKFDTFYRGVHDDLYGKIRLPRAKMNLDTRMAELRSGWEDRVRQYSDERAIDHARTITQDSINQGIKNLDVNRVLSELRSAQEAMIYTEEDLLTIRDTALNQIIYDQTMNYARMLDDEGMLWLMGEEAGGKFAIDIDDQRFFLDRETLNDMAVQLSAERSNRKKAEDAAMWQYRKTMMDYAQEQIESGKLTSVEQLYDDEHQEEFINRHGFILDLSDEDKDRVRTVLANRADAFEKDRESYSDDMLETVSDAIKAGDAETAQRYLEELIDEGYAHDAMGRVDPEIRRYIEQLERMQAGELTDFDKDANELRAKLRAEILTEADLGTFLEKHPTKEGRVEHDKMWNELEQQQRERESKTVEARMIAEYDEYFDSIYYHLDADSAVALRQLEALDQWRYDNYPQNKKNPTRPGIEPHMWRSYGDQIESKKKELQEGQPNYYVDAAKRGIVKLYNEETKDLATEDEFEPAAQNEREKYETVGAFDQWVKDFKNKNGREPTPDEVDAAYKNFTQPLLTNQVQKRLTRGIALGLHGETWQARKMSPEEVMKIWHDEGRLDLAGKLIGISLEQQFQVLGITSFEDLDLDWLKEQGVSVLPYDIVRQDQNGRLWGWNRGDPEWSLINE